MKLWVLSSNAATYQFFDNVSFVFSVFYLSIIVSMKNSVNFYKL